MSAKGEQIQRMSAQGYNHVGTDEPDPALSEENRRNMNFQDASFTGAGYSMTWEPAYEADGETLKEGWVTIYYN